MVIARVAPCRRPVEVKDGIVRWQELWKLGPPRIASELVVRQGINACLEFLRDALLKQFSGGGIPTTPGDALTMELDVHRVFGQAADRFFHRFVEAAHQSDEFVDHVMEAALARPRVYR